MSPWKVLGWLLVALLCLLLTAGAYGLALLWGWVPPVRLVAGGHCRGRGGRGADHFSVPHNARRYA